MVSEARRVIDIITSLPKEKDERFMALDNLIRYKAEEVEKLRHNYNELKRQIAESQLALSSTCDSYLSAQTQLLNLMDERVKLVISQQAGEIV